MNTSQQQSHNKGVHIMIASFNKGNAIQELFEMVIAGMITIEDMWIAVQMFKGY